MAETLPFITNPEPEYWVCACVKRNRKGVMTAIRTNHPDVKRCSKCGCTKERHDQLDMEMKMRETNGPKR